MARTYEVLLTDRRWKLVEPFIPKVACSPLAGRPRADDRACLEGILWVLRSDDSGTSINTTSQPKNDAPRNSFSGSGRADGLLGT